MKYLVDGSCLRFLRLVFLLVGIMNAGSSLGGVAEQKRDQDRSGREEVDEFSPGSQGSASPTPGKWSLGVAKSFVFVRELNGVDIGRFPVLSAEVGYSVLPRWKLFLEYSHYQNQTGTDSYSISESRHDLNAWYLFTGHRKKWLDGWIGGGLGWSHESVTHRLYSETVTGNDNGIFRIALRGDLILWINSHLFVDLHSRFYLWNISPSPTFQVGLMLGYHL